MPNCKTCEKEFHACSSCDLYYFWEYEYCSSACWRRSEEYKKMIDRISKFYLTLNDDMVSEFIDFINNVPQEYFDEFLRLIGGKNGIKKETETSAT